MSYVTDERPWLHLSDAKPQNGQVVAALHTSWGAPRPAIATYSVFPDGSHEWFSGGMSLQTVVGWLPLGPLEAPL